MVGYRAAGFGLCRLDAGEKNPPYPAWSTTSVDDPDLYDEQDNVGVLCGWLSDGGRPNHCLVGIDIDGPAALAAADASLPHSDMIEGRVSKPRSHRYYLVPTESIPDWAVSTADAAVEAARFIGRHPGPFKRQFRDTTGRVQLELIGTGGQLAAPPSVHPSGEVREWTDGAIGPPAVVPFPDLWGAVVQLAAAAGCRTPPGGPKFPTVRCGERAESANGTRPTDAERVRRARSYLNRSCAGSGIPGTMVGHGAHAACFRLACRMVQGFGLSVEEALPLMLVWGRRDDQHDEFGGYAPWSERELLHKLRDAARRGDPHGRPTGWMLREREGKSGARAASPACGRYADWFARHLAPHVKE